jgi:hypothetical protein
LSFKFLLQTFEFKLNRNQIHFRIQTSSNIFKNRNLRLLNQNNFKTQIQNLNQEYFRNRACGASMQILFQNEIKSNSNFDETECFLHALEY